jgi:hypothetical protein
MSGSRWYRDIAALVGLSEGATHARVSGSFSPASDVDVSSRS